MSLEQIANANKRLELKLDSITVVIKPMSTRNLLRLLGVIDRMRNDMKLTREELEKVKLNSSGVADLVQRIFNACVGSTDYSKPGSISPNAQVLFNELSVVLECKPEELLDADINDLVVIVEKFWEVNSNGPLGQKILATTATLKPMLSLGRDVILTNFQRALIQDLPVGGTEDGGQTGSSGLSTSDTTGQSTTS